MTHEAEVCEAQLLGEGTFWPPFASLEAGVLAPRSKQLRKPGHSCSSSERNCGCSFEATSGWDFTKCLVVLEYLAGF